MKTLKRILFSIITILILTVTTTYAAETQLQITGDNEAKAGDTKKILVKLVSDKDIGVITGKVEGDTNVTDIKVTGKSDWMCISENESFKLIKAQGAKNEDVLEITYTIKEEAADKVSIKLTNLELTTIEYETIKITEVLKEVTIKINEPEPDEPAVKELSSIEISKAPTKIKYTEGESFDKSGMEITAKYSDGTSKVITDYTYTPNGSLKESDKKIIISYKENNITKQAEQAITVEKKKEETPKDTNTTDNNNNTNNTNQSSNTGSSSNQSNSQNANNNKQNTTVIKANSQTESKDNTVANKVLSKAGKNDFVYCSLIVIVALGIVFYVKYKNIKEI